GADETNEDGQRPAARLASARETAYPEKWHQQVQQPHHREFERQPVNHTGSQLDPGFDSLQQNRTEKSSARVGRHVYWRRKPSGQENLARFDHPAQHKSETKDYRGIAEPRA